MAKDEVEEAGYRPDIRSPHHRHTSFSTANTEKGIGDDAEKDKPSGREYESSEDLPPIVYHYLEFGTDLPPPSILQLPNKDTPPEAPDLVKYTSPFEWNPVRKSVLVWLSVTVTMLTAFTAGSYSPGATQMIEYWHVSHVAILVGITIFTCGFGVAPMVLAPFSEIQGRKPVFLVTGVLFVVCQLCCGVTRTYGGMLISRFLVGVGGSTFSTMVGGIVSDIYHTKERNTPMSLFSGAALLGTGLGPLVAGWIAQNTTWRWIFYAQTIVDGILIFIIAFVFKETRGSVLLSRKAKMLNKWYEAREEAGYYNMGMFLDEKEPTKLTPQRIRWRVKADEERASLFRMITISLYRPFHLLVTEPVVFFFSLWVSFSWAVLYLTFAAIPQVFQDVYSFSIGQANSVFAATAVGAILATILSIWQDKVAYHFFPNWSHKHLDLNPANPEARLYFACIESVLMPIGLFWFGWSSRESVHWIVPSIAISVATMGIFSIYLAVFNYLADTYHRYASSALAAQSFCRNILGGIFPLVTVQMYTGLGYGGASSLLGGIGLVLTTVPWVLVMFGPKIRARSKFASDLARQG